MQEINNYGSCLYQVSDVIAAEKTFFKRSGSSNKYWAEKVGIAVAQWVLANAVEKHCFIICGKGGNGADGIFAAIHLKKHGASVEVCLGYPSTYSHRFLDVPQLLDDNQVPFSSYSTLDLTKMPARSVIIDALFGIGGRSDLGVLSQLYDQINALPALRVSIDVPSGVDAKTGQVAMHACRAEVTLAAQVLKKELMTGEAFSCAGHVVLLDVGLGIEPFMESLVFSLQADALVWLRDKLKCNQNTHKYNEGTVFVHSAGVKHKGAMILAGLAADKSGVGRVVLLGNDLDQIAISHPSLMINQNASLGSYRCCHVLGPGVVESLETSLDLKGKDGGVVVDAGMLKHDILQGLSGDVIATPHSGELARLLQIKSRAVSYSRFDMIDEISKRYPNFVWVLKGPGTIIAYRDNRYVITAGSNVLAKAGTGDVLAGLTAGFYAQGLKPLEAAIMGALLHGTCGDEWVKRNGRIGFTVSDLLAMIPGVCRMYIG